MDTIRIRGARQHNLKNIDLELPRRALVVVTGVSGSGKSSLAFDTIFAEGQRRYIESLSTYARQFIEKLERPDVDDIAGLSPTIAIRQKNTVTSARSTVGTATEIYDYLRLLFARVGRTVCPRCRIEVRAHTPSDAAQEIIAAYGGTRISLLMPIGSVDAAEWKTKRGYLLSRGYSRLFAGGEAVRVEDYAVGRGARAEIVVLFDRLDAVEANRTRIAEVVELAYRESAGSIEVAGEGGTARRFTQAPLCSSCGASYQAPSPLLFSFNSPYGACPDCHGFGDRMEFAEDLIVPDRRLSIEKRAIDPWSRERFAYFQHRLLEFCRAKRIPALVPWMDLPAESRKLVLEGEGKYLGVIPFLEKLREKSYKKGHRFFTRKYMAFTTCRTCEGGRLTRDAYHVRIGDFTIRDLVRMIPARALEAIEGAPYTDQDRRIAKDILSEISARLRFMIDVGLGYLTLDRLTRTLSGGEAQRINLANSLGASLVDALYILDEPSIGLHAADNERLVSVLRRLRDLGNTVLVVEHDPDIIRSCDYLVDLGPGPGSRGGAVLFSGTIERARAARVPESRTIDWLFHERPGAAVPKRRRRQYGSIELEGVVEHNLKGVDVRFPLGLVTCVTGVSGSGKSSLVVDVLYPAASRDRIPAMGRLGIKRCDIRGALDRVLLVDQSAIGSSPRSNPITYIKGFSFIRDIFASQQAASGRGFDAGRFSFNRSGGRCPRCQGMGFRRVEMHFMADVFVPCEECEGKRYNAETLEVRYRGKDISEVLAMTVDDAILFFDAAPQLGEKLWILSKVGLGYLTLGQPSNTLSGGEAQRIKIARELAESTGQRNLYILDEPTTGLHMSDVDRLLGVFDELVAAGHTVVVIEHNMEVIAWSDHVIDLGPGGGDEGGAVIACGPPESIVQSPASLTGKYLGAYLARYGGRSK